MCSTDLGMSATVRCSDHISFLKKMQYISCSLMCVHILYGHLWSQNAIYSKTVQTHTGIILSAVNRVFFSS